MRWSIRKTLRVLLGVYIAAAVPVPLLANCELKRTVELPIDMHGHRPTIAVQFNGRDARLVLDSGAGYSMLSAATAAQYNLKLQPAPFGLRVGGVGGYAETDVTTVKDFGLIGLTLHNVEFLVGGSEVAGGAGTLGQNLLSNFDDEYDLARGTVRLFKTEGCSKSLLAYWATPGQSYSVLKIESMNPKDPHTIGDASVNGKSIRVMFDTGSYTSILSLRAAERAGVKSDSAGVVEAGSTIGIGRTTTKTYLARFNSFKIGDSEEIQHTRLRIGDLGTLNADMLLGADFFLSHRIFISNKEHKAFITFNGGSVFNLSTTAAPATAPAAAAPDATASGLPAAGGDMPSDAAGYARRGEGFAARRDFTQALADLTKACELEPDEPEYFYRRALTYLQTGDASSALADLDRVIALKQDFLAAYLARAEIHIGQKDAGAAEADLASFERLAPKQADLRLQVGRLYARLNHYLAATTQFDLWIDAHPDDARMAQALSSRCWIRTVQDQDLGLALDDCNKALKRADKHDADSSQFFASRGMVRVRQGDYDKAIADFNDALKLQPKNAQALYGRGVAEAHKQQTEAATADIASARGLEPKLPERYQRIGIAP